MDLAESDADALCLISGDNWEECTWEEEVGIVAEARKSPLLACNKVRHKYRK